MSLSHSLIASAADDGLSLHCFGMYWFFHRWISISNNSGDGRSELYWFTHAPKSIGFEEHKMDGTRPNSLTAVIDEPENC